MSPKLSVCLVATAIALTACGGGSDSTGTPSNSIALQDILANGTSLEDSSSHWLCATTNSALTADGRNQNQFRFFSDFTGRQGDTEIGADQGIRWSSPDASTLNVTFTDVDPESQTIFNDIVLNADNTQFSSNVEELVGLNLGVANYSCSLINESGNSAPTGGNNTDGGADTPTLAQRLISDGTAETGSSWGCTYSNSSDSHVYGFNADNTGSDFSSADSTTTGIDFVITEPDSIRATFFNTSFASLFWNQIVFSDEDNFTANDGLALEADVVVSCTRGAPAAPPAPEQPAPISAVCPCEIDSVAAFLNNNGTASTFVTVTTFAGGRSADIDLDGDSVIEMGVIVRDTGIRDCSFSPFSPEFGVEDPGQQSLSASQATACMTDLDELLNQEL